MQAATAKPYFIELFSTADNALKNKFKFVLKAQKVQELKALIREKLMGKNELQADSQFALKDGDDFELASDDEVDDVIPDRKVRIYRKDQPIPQPAQPVQAPQVQQSVAPVVPAVNAPNLDLVTRSPVLNLSNLTFPPADPMSKRNLKAYCPQIRKTLIEIPLSDGIDSHLDLSKWLVSQLGLDANLKALLYSRYGQPFVYNLDLMNQPLPKLDFDEPMWVMFTSSESTLDTPPHNPNEPENTVSTVFIIKGANKYELKMDLDTSLATLKYKVYQVTKVHPMNQILKYANKTLSNDVEPVKSYGIAEGSIVELSFKIISNQVPVSFASKFYFKDIKHTRPQSDESVTHLRLNLLILAAHLSDDDKLKMVTFMRAYTHNLPLTFGLKCLLRNNFVSQAHRIAIEEGLLTTVSEYLKTCTPQLDKLEFKDIFLHFRDFLGFAIEGFKEMKNIPEIRAGLQDVQIHAKCHFTYQPIKRPKLITLDNNEKVLVDQDAFEEQILKGFTFPMLKGPKKENLFCPGDLQEFFYQYLHNQYDNENTNTLFWLGFNKDHPQVVLPEVGASDKYKATLDAYKDMKVHQPLEIKNKSTTYLLLKTKDDKMRVFVSKNKDIAKPYNIYDVLKGEEEAVNLDLMGANVQSENVEEVIDVKDLKPVITREPKEAIAILFDISYSMSGQFFNEPDLKRIGAVKSFFEAFAFRTIAYNFEHVVSLFFFDNHVENQCDFTEAIYDFNRLISNAKPRGSTTMYDAAAQAIDSLKAFKLRYPNCVLRILALTDGEDNGSKISFQETAQLAIQHEVIVDSFAVGTNCDGLKTISKASGGNCYLTRNLEESLKLFEQQTVLSVRARKMNEDLTSLPVLERIVRAQAMPFDLPNNVHEFKMPEVKGGLSAKDIMKKMQGTEEAKKIAGSGSLKRIAKEIENYTQNPHPFVAIFPCSNINLWKILLLGPKETPYENGLFILYAQFPGDYPFKAPEVRFITPIYHCNMNQQGRICHSVFDRNYSPALTFRQIIDCVYGLILTPEPEDPLDNVIASYYLSDYPKYLKNATEATKEKASPSTEKIVDELFGKIVDDSERKQKEQEIEDWIKLAKSFN